MSSARYGDLSYHTLQLERRKLGMLLARAQGQLRRAMAYLRFDEGDAGSLVPSVYLSKPRGRRAEESEDETPLPDAPAAAPATTPSADNPFES